MSKIKDLEKRRGELEAKIEGIRSAITNENRAMTAEERSMVERTELELRGITREIADEVAQEQLRRMPAPAVDANVQFRSFLKSAQPGVNYNMELRGITLAGGGNAVQGISVQDIVDTDRNEPDLFGVLGISIPTGISGNAIQWPYCGGVTVKIQNELTESTEVTPDLDKQTAVPVRLTTCVKISNQTIENSSADLLGFVKTAIRKALMKKLTFAACSTTKAASSFYGGFAETGKQTGTYTDFTYKTAGEMIGKLSKKGIPVDGTTAFVMGGDLFWELKTTPRDNGSGLMVIDENNRLLGLPVVACNDINRSEEGGVAGTGNVGLANFGYLPVVNHGNIRMSVDNSSATAANIDATIITINADFSMTVMKEFQDAFVLYSKS